MSHWEDLRKLARQRRAEALAAAKGDPSAAALLAATDRLTGFERFGLPGDDTLLDGGEAVLDPNLERIWFNRNVEPRLALFYQAHEYAHLWLHRDRTSCAETDLDAEEVEETIPLGEA